MMTNDRRVIVSGWLPRKTVDLSPYNDRLKLLCDAYEREYIDNFKNFLLASGEIPASYFRSDKVHLNNFGLRKLLSNINRVHQITSPRQAPSSDRQMNTTKSGCRRAYVARNYARGGQYASTFCHICSRDGHETRECWFNGRNNGWPERTFR